MKSVWRGAAALVTRWPRRVLAGALAATVVMAAGIPLLAFETSQDSLVGEGNPVTVDNRLYQEAFGGEMMFVLLTARGDHTVEDLASPGNHDAIAAFDERLRASGLVHGVVSPVTALTFARSQVAVGPAMFEAAAAHADDPGALRARLQATAARLDEAMTEGERLGLENPLTLDNPAFVRFLLYEDVEAGEIRSAMQNTFVDRTHALVIARLHGNVEIAEMGEAADLVRAEAEALTLDGFDVHATGPPVLLQDINDYLQGGMANLGALAVGVMIAVLFIVFRVRWRLLSLVIVALGAVWAFGIMGFLGIPLTLITISGLPILIGLGVDFSIQTHSRFEEEVAAGDGHHVAVGRLMAGLTPALVVAMVAAAVGFLTLQLSAVPLIRDFGAMLAIGVVVLVVAAILVPASILVRRETARPTPLGLVRLPAGPLERAVRWLSFAARRIIVPLSLATVLVLAAGLVVESRFTIQTDPEKWLPPDGQTVAGLEILRERSGSSTELSLLVEADDVTASPVASWIARFAAAQVEAHDGQVLRATSMAGIAASVTGMPPGQEEIELLLSVAPDDVAATLLDPDDPTRAAVVFPIANLSLEQRERVLDDMVAALEEMPPPDGVRVRPAGLAAVGVELMNGLEANRLTMTWTAVAAVALWLLVSYRRLLYAALPMLPVLFAVGLSSLVIYWSGVELSPLTAVSAPLVIATCTEFSVLVMARYIEERRRGRDPDDAVGVGAVRIGRAFVASGLTVVGGFGVLAFSSFPLLADFGTVVGLNVLVALLTVLVILPPLLMWADRHLGLIRPPEATDTRDRPLAAARR